MMTHELKQKWIEALRSGKYRQVQGSLHTANGFCALGLLREVIANSGQEPIGIRFFFDGFITSSIWDKIVDQNDHKLRTFPEIADWVEKHIEAV